jgi:hypothetical protein
MQRKYHITHPAPGSGPPRLPLKRHMPSAILSRQVLRELVAQMID